MYNNTIKLFILSFNCEFYINLGKYIQILVLYLLKINKNRNIISDCYKYISGDEVMEYNYLVALAIILLSTKLFSLASKKIHMPQVLGALIAGVILGQSALNMVHESEFLTLTSELGVILLMFIAGIDTDLKQLKKTGLASAIIAIVGVAIPLGGGYLLYEAFFRDVTDPLNMLKALFIGVILTATSVSITVETLRELGKLNGKIGTTIVGAAVIDDILGIIVLTVISSLKEGGKGKIFPALGKIGLFFVFLAIVGTLVHFIFVWLKDKYGSKRRIAIYALSFCLFMAYSATTFFGVADIAGAYFAGLFLCNIAKTRQYVASKLNIASYMLFSPVFFASIGINTNISSINKNILLFSVVFIVVGVLTKVVGCGLTAKALKFNKIDALTIGVGMVTRGEVCLVVAQKGKQLGLISTEFFPCIVLLVIITSLSTPILLKILINKSAKKGVEVDKANLSDSPIELNAIKEEDNKIDTNRDHVDFEISDK